MKVLLILVSLFCSMPAFAHFYAVKEKYCNQKKISVQSGERVYIDLNNLIVGFGFTDDQNCRVVDFNAVVINQQVLFNTDVTVQRSVVRRSSCSLGNLSYAGPEFTGATITENSILIFGLRGECASMLYQF